MNNKALWFVVVVVVAAVVLWWVNADRAPAPALQGASGENQSAASLKAEVEAVDTGSTDADFKEIDADLKAL